MYVRMNVTFKLNKKKRCQLFPSQPPNPPQKKICIYIYLPYYIYLNNIVSYTIIWYGPTPAAMMYIVLCALYKHTSFSTSTLLLYVYVRMNVTFKLNKKNRCQLLPPKIKNEIKINKYTIILYGLTSAAMMYIVLHALYKHTSFTTSTLLLYVCKNGCQIEAKEKQRGTSSYQQKKN